jgi:hypothetical protein
MKLLGEVFGQETDWIPTYLAQSVDKALSESDWTFEGLKVFMEEMGPHYMGANRFVTCQDIAEWAQGEEEFSKCDMLINARRLARYLMTHKSIIAMSCGLIEQGKRNNKVVYKVVPTTKRL